MRGKAKIRIIATGAILFSVFSFNSVSTFKIEDTPTLKAYISGRTTLDPKAEPSYSRQDFFDTIKIGDSWTKSKGENVTVAIVDTGIYYNHQEFYDLQGNSIISTKSINISENRQVTPLDYSPILDDSYHGTAVASVVASQVNNKGISGVAPDVDLMIIKANLNSDGRTFANANDLVRGLAYAIDNDADVINMSIEYLGNNIFASQIDRAVAKGITVVAAAGNSNVSTSSYPASDEDCIGVGALAEDSLDKANFSNYGKKNLTVMAPGMDIYVAHSQSASSYATLDGTSFSAPIVSGVAALYKSLYPAVTTKEMINLFAASSTDLGDKGFDSTFGYGVVDVETLVSGEKGTITYNYLDGEVSNETRMFFKGHTLQMEPSLVSNGKNIEGWFYDREFNQPYDAKNDILNEDVEVFAKYQEVVSDVDNVINLINEIGEINEANYISKNDLITEAKNAYEALSEQKKLEVTNYNLLVSSINQYDAYDYVTYFRQYRVNGDICWVLSDEEEYELIIGLYDLLEDESKAIVDESTDIDSVKIGDTIAYLKMMYAHINNQTEVLRSEIELSSQSNIYPYLIIGGLLLSSLIYIAFKRKRSDEN